MSLAVGSALVLTAFGAGAEGCVQVEDTANTNALEHAGSVLATWEGGSAFALDPDGLAARGPATWRDGYEQVPFSAHPMLDARGICETSARPATR